MECISSETNTYKMQTTFNKHLKADSSQEYDLNDEKSKDLNIIIVSIVSMDSNFLDKVSTTISVSMKTKNDLKNRKGSLSYEEYIRTLMRNQEKNTISASNTLIQSTFTRTNGIYKIDDVSIIFAYNKYMDISNFRFDIELKTIRKEGKLISFEEYIKERDSFQDYFKILEKIIQKEIEPMFNFKKYGREDYKDYAAWERHFTNLRISTTSFEEDVLDKLNNLQTEESPYV